MPRVSVIIPHRGAPEDLVGCIEALSLQSSMPDEIIIALNDKLDTSVDVYRSIQGINSRVIVVHEPRPSAGLARNAGVAASSGALLAFVDSDCRPATDWIANGRLAMSVAPLFGGAVNVVTAGTNPTPVELFDLEFGFDAVKFLKRSGHLLTSNLFCTRAIFDTVGPFRSGVPEDKEWSLRARAAGIGMTVRPEVVVAHPALSSWPQLAYRWRRITTEEFIYSSERRFGLLQFWLRSWLVLASIVPHGVRIFDRFGLSRVTIASVILVLARVRIYRFAWAQVLVAVQLRSCFRKLSSDPTRHLGRQQQDS